MVRMETPVCDFGWQAPDFDLPGVDGRRYSLRDVAGAHGLLVMFICNHCPYVKAVIHRIVRDVNDLRPLGVGAIAILSNDPTDYPVDSFENMKRTAAELAFPMPYVLDASQAVARTYGAVCTPDFFGFNDKLQLQYRGRLDESRKETAPEGVRRDLFEAMKQIARSGHGPAGQIPSMGCSIKWREE